MYRSHLSLCRQDTQGKHQSKDEFVTLKEASLDVQVNVIGEELNDIYNSFGWYHWLLTAINGCLI